MNIKKIFLSFLFFITLKAQEDNIELCEFHLEKKLSDVELKNPINSNTCFNHPFLNRFEWNICNFHTDAKSKEEHFAMIMPFKFNIPKK